LENEQTIVSAIKKIIVGLIIAEYGLIQLKDATKQDLKSRTNAAINSIKQVENWFKYHPSVNSLYRKVFEKEFLKGEMVLMAELFETCFGFNEETLEIIINSIKNSTSAATKE
jgi:hypothetical protein